MNQITIYSTPTCHYCDLAKQYFKENNINYTEYNVKEDITRRNEAIELSGKMGVPVININGKIMAGWSEESFKRIIAE
jgi:glutaredoxin 3